MARISSLTYEIPLAEGESAFTDAGLPFTDLGVLPYPSLSTLAVGSRGGGPEEVMARGRRLDAKRNTWWISAIWFSGVALFVLELDAGLDYVQARLSNLAPHFLGFLPALGVAAWKVIETGFWHCGQLETTFETLPLVILPFVLVILALSMNSKFSFQRQVSKDK